MLVISVGMYFKALPTSNPTIWNTPSKIPYINSWLTTDCFGWSIGMKCGMRSCTPYILITGVIIEYAIEIHLLVFVPSVVNYIHLWYVILSILESTHSPCIWVCILSPVSYAHSDAHPPCTYARYLLILQMWCLTSIRGLCVSALSDMSRSTTRYFFLDLFVNFFLNFTMARNLKQIDQLNDYTGGYFLEEMWHIVIITFDFRIPIGIFFPLSLYLLSFSILHIVFTCRSKLIKYLILHGLCAHHLTPNESVTVLHTAKICLGQSVTDAKIKEG